MSITPSAGDAQYDATTGTYRAPDLGDAAEPAPAPAPPRRPIGLSAVVAAVVLLALLVVLWLAVVLA